MDRDRAFAAILLDGKIAMVRVDEKDRSYWTLPGGGVEEGESREEAAVREAMEETNLKIKIVRFLFQENMQPALNIATLLNRQREDSTLNWGMIRSWK